MRDIIILCGAPDKLALPVDGSGGADLIVSIDERGDPRIVKDRDGDARVTVISTHATDE